MRAFPRLTQSQLLPRPAWPAAAGALPPVVTVMPVRQARVQSGERVAPEQRGGEGHSCPVSQKPLLIPPKLKY